MPLLRTFDAFARPMEGLRTRTATGGLITLLAATLSILLFLSQVFVYLQVETRHSFHLADSISSPLFTKTPTQQNKRDLALARYRLQKNHLPINIHVTFPRVKCRDLEYAIDEAHRHDLNVVLDPVSSGGNSIQKVSPTRKELMASGFWIDGVRPGDGCTIKGKIMVPPVGGSLAITVSRKAWEEVTRFINTGYRDERKYGDGDAPKMFNVSHYIHTLDFGTPFPLSSNPLSNSQYVFQSDSGIGLSNIMVKIIPTQYKRIARRMQHTHQLSVTHHMVETQTLAAQHATIFPGMILNYDFSPLQVHHLERRENFVLFLSSLVSIVGGVFVVVGVVGSVLLNAADLAAKKKD